MAEKEKKWNDNFPALQISIPESKVKTFTWVKPSPIAPFVRAQAR